jgi:hypothetical protein
MDVLVGVWFTAAMLELTCMVPGVHCSVAQAIAKAIQMSVAVTLRRNPLSLTVSPQAMYYCATPAGCSCKTG